MAYEGPVSLKREVEVIQIPSGQPAILPAGMQVQITQSLGGTYTVITDQGYMVRIDGKDADALGKEPVVKAANDAATNLPLEKQIWNQLKTVYDPEIPVNIADLGLVYECKMEELPDSGGVNVNIKMTLTAPGCGMGDALRVDVERKVSKVPGVSKVNCQLIWEPPWDRHMMSDAAKLQLGML